MMCIFLKDNRKLSESFPSGLQARPSVARPEGGADRNGLVVTASYPPTDGRRIRWSFGFIVYCLISDFPLFPFPSFSLLEESHYNK